MKPRRKIIIGIMALLAALGISTIVFEIRHGPKEAYYQGKSASYWLNELFGNREKQDVTLRAFREMGTNAYPVLLDAFGREAPTPAVQWFRARLASIPYLGRLVPTLASQRNLRSAASLVLLNAPARSFSPVFMHALLQFLQQTNSEVRMFVLQAIARQIGPANRDEVPILVSVLNDPDPVVRQDAMSVLSDIGKGASNAIPAISKACQDTNLDARVSAAWALWNITGRTNSVVPALRSALTPNNPRRHWAACDLEQIGQRDAGLIPIFIDSLTNSDEGIRSSAPYCLLPFGSAAKAAVPNLLTALRDPSSRDVREAAKAALRAIDPETAANAIQE